MAAGFVLRVVGGAVAIPVAVSHWLLVCAYLLALYLALGKRRSELVLLGEQAGVHRAVLGSYTMALVDQAISVVLGATVVAYTLYTVSPAGGPTRGQMRLVSKLFAAAVVVTISAPKANIETPGITVAMSCSLTNAIKVPSMKTLSKVHGPMALMMCTPSAEPGVGVLKKGFLQQYRSGVEIELMRTLKRSMDPANTLNPGKVI